MANSTSITIIILDCTHTYKHTHIQTHKHTYTNTNTHIRTQTNKHTHTHKQVCQFTTVGLITAIYGCPHSYLWCVPIEVIPETYKHNKLSKLQDALTIRSAMPTNEMLKHSLEKDQSTYSSAIFRWMLYLIYMNVV